MGSITLAQYRTNVRGLIGDSSYDATLTDQAINWFLNEIHNNSRISYMEENDTLTVAAGDISVDFPDDYQTLLNLTLLTPQIINIKKGRLEYDDFMERYPGYKTYSPAQILQWTFYSRAMRLAAPSKTAATIDIDYLRRIVPMTEDDSTTDMPDVYEELVSKGALARLMEINEDYAEAAQERNNLDPLLTTFIRNEGRGGEKVGPTVMKSNRGRRAGATPGDGTAYV